MDSIVIDDLGKRYWLGKARPQAWWQAWLAPSPTGKSVRQREIWALRQIDLTVAPGTIVGVIGPNGAGKTTLLKILARVTLPTAGRAIVRGRVASLLEVGAGFQSELTVRENIMLYAALYGISRAEVMRRFDDIIDFAELSAFVDTPVRRLSSGMYLRLAFSVVLNMQPDILLADEVLAVGDLSFQERCLERVKAAGAAGMTVLFVSHDLAAIRRLCDRAVWLKAGQIVDSGATDGVVSRYQSATWASLAPRTTKGKSSKHRGVGELLGVHLLSATGEEIGAARVSDDIQVRLVFRLHQAGLRAQGAIDVYSDGVHAFRSIQPVSTPLAAPGVYSARVRIPAHLLADTTYTVNASVILSDDAQEYPLVQFNALDFPVYDQPDAAGLGLQGKRRLAGIVAPRLQWSPTEQHLAGSTVVAAFGAGTGG